MPRLLFKHNACLRRQATQHVPRTPPILRFNAGPEFQKSIGKKPIGRPNVVGFRARYKVPNKHVKRVKVKRETSVRVEGRRNLSNVDKEKREKRDVMLLASLDLSLA
jgi:hypothetical protein